MAPQEDTTEKRPADTVPAEEITKEAKEAEPDAAEQNDKMEKKGMDNLPTIT